MFTGLIEAIGRVDRTSATPAGRRLRIRTTLGAGTRPGDSLAVNGVCLTAVQADVDGFDADVAPETERVTTLGRLQAGDRVNLERPLRADARLGGHFVLGHVDGIGRVEAIRREAECAWVDIGIPEALEPLVVLKGSIAIDGISLTVAALAPGRVSVQVVPFTLAHTTLGEAKPGAAVNLEGDVLGKYVARLLALRPESVPVHGGTS